MADLDLLRRIADFMREARCKRIGRNGQRLTAADAEFFDRKAQLFDDIATDAATNTPQDVDTIRHAQEAAERAREYARELRDTGTLTTSEVP